MTRRRFGVDDDVGDRELGDGDVVALAGGHSGELSDLLHDVAAIVDDPLAVRRHRVVVRGRCGCGCGSGVEQVWGFGGKKVGGGEV